tara:strand:- start:1064 stop:1348 length:285 start_codon:yes stop_codon:yes gene_type:complete
MKNHIPYEDIQTAEFEKSFYSFCTFVALVHDKKMNFATVFLKILENKALRDIFISIIEEENDFTAIKKYIQTEPSVTKSKYVTKFLNKFNGLND